MSLDIKGQQCAVCKAYLFEDDDIVYCPTCGAPHHRDCYKAVGHCGMEEYHGTDKQYKKIKIEEKPEIPESKPTCRGCKMALEEDSKFCPYCGLPVNGLPTFANENLFGQTAVEIKDDEPIDEGVTVKDAAKTVVINPFRYIPKFLSLNEKRKKSWNWAAFLLPHGWFAYRKMYMPAVITSAFMLMAELLNIPLNIAINQLPKAEDVKTYVDYAYYIAGNIGEIGILPLILSVVGLAINITVRIISGIYGDWIYKNSVVSRVRKIRQEEDSEEIAKKLSGVSLIGFGIAVCSVNLLLQILAIFII